MKKEFVTYEIALKLKELGFDEECLGAFISENIFLFGESSQVNYMKWDAPAILWQQATSFLFEKFNFYYPYLRLEVYSDESGVWVWNCDYPVDEDNDAIEFEFKDKEDMILKAIELIEKTNEK